jgi:pyruvate kinase
MTRIITTIGPSSQDIGTLLYFAEHKVEYARLNYSHNVPEWHIEIGKKARQAGLKLLADLSGPKIRLGDIVHDLDIQDGQKVIFEKQNAEKSYPEWEQVDGHEVPVLPTNIDLAAFLESEKDILLDDGKLHLTCKKTADGRVYAQVVFGGKVKTHKGINLPGTDVKIPFLTERDKAFLRSTIDILKPEYVASSFVKTAQDVRSIKDFIKNLLVERGVDDYFPKICTKLEMGEAVEPNNLSQIIDESDMLMVARGDLALESHPLHTKVPFIQEEIKKLCNQKDKPFIVATQVLESMATSPVPTRAEVSDLYRAVILDKANFVMLSGESASGLFPRKCVDLMETMILESEKLV